MAHYQRILVHMALLFNVNGPNAFAQSHHAFTIPKRSQTETVINDLPLLSNIPNLHGNLTHPFSSKPVKEWHPSDKWALVIGVSNFESGAADVPFCARNAQEFAELLVAKENFRPDHIWLLIDKDATTTAIRRAIGDKWLPAVARPDDLAVVYISTHGTEPGQDLGGESKIYGYESQYDDDYSTAITIREIWDRLNEAYKCEHIVVFVDACNSGGQLCLLSDQRNAAKARALLPKTNIFTFSACAKDQQSYPLPEKNSTAFAYHLINGLKSNPERDLTTICQEAGVKVTNDVRAQLQKVQTPKVSSCGVAEPIIMDDAPKSRSKSGAAR